MNNEASQFVSVTQQQALSFLKNLKLHLERQKKIEISINKKNLQYDVIHQINFEGEQIPNIDSESLFEDPSLEQPKLPVLRRKRFQSKKIKGQQQSTVEGNRRNRKKNASVVRTNSGASRVYLHSPMDMKNMRPKEAKNIIKNIINGFKKFPRLLDIQTMTRIVNKLPHPEKSIALEKRLEINMKGVAQTVKKQYFEVFKENMYGEEPSQKKQRLLKKKIENQKANANKKKEDNDDEGNQQKDVSFVQFNKALIEQIFQRNQLRQIFLFWLQQCAHYYIAKQSKIKIRSQTQHRAAIQTLLQTLNSPKAINPPSGFKKQIFKQGPTQDILFPKCPSFKHQITQVFGQPFISKLFRRQNNCSNQPLTTKKFSKNKPPKINVYQQYSKKKQSQNKEDEEQEIEKEEGEGEGEGEEAIVKKRKLQ